MKRPGPTSGRTAIQPSKQLYPRACALEPAISRVPPCCCSRLYWHQGSLDRRQTPHKVKYIAACDSSASSVVADAQLLRSVPEQSFAGRDVCRSFPLPLYSVLYFTISACLSSCLPALRELPTHHIIYRPIHQLLAHPLPYGLYISRTNLPLQDDPRCQAQPWRKTVVGRPLKTPPSPTSLFLQLVSQNRPELLVSFSLVCPYARTRAASSVCRWLGAFPVAFGKDSSLM